MGYVIGTSSDVSVDTGLSDPLGGATGTEPEDFVEGKGQGSSLYPQSLYEDQRKRRLAN